MKRILLLFNIIISFSQLKANIGVDTFGTLPFRLQAFSARVVTNSEIKIYFTNAETFPNVTHFEILRSVNNIDFTSIGIVRQTNDNPTAHSYEFTDRLQNVVTGQTIYYRLLQVSADLRSTYSFILPVKLNSVSTPKINVWPIPANNELNINFENKENAEIGLRFLDLNGKQIYQEKINSGKGNCTIKSTAVKNFKTGNYILQIFTGSTLVGSTTFLKN